MGRQRHIAFYLPQFHPIPENDEWWGPGFTEWTNVATARPRFRGHHQPHIPADLGFYDLRLPETRQAQANLATQHGIDGFCYYHYWFGGKQLLERPFEDVLQSGDPSLPFSLCWANENWTRSWDGEHRSILMEQNYEQDELEHAHWLANAFRDDRYIRVDGRPLFLVYRASDLPDPQRTTRLWRDVARSRGIGELFLCRVESFANERTDPRKLGFDGAVEFAPDWVTVTRSFRHNVRAVLQRTNPARRHSKYRVHNYRDIVVRMMAKPEVDYLRFPCVTPGWDNSARRADGALVLRGSTPEQYGDWVRHASSAAPTTPGGDSFVFVNAWNEWGEGAHLEPCQHWGRAYLEAHRAARSSLNSAEIAGS